MASVRPGCYQLDIIEALLSQRYGSVLITFAFTTTPNDITRSPDIRRIDHQPSLSQDNPGLVSDLIHQTSTNAMCRARWQERMDILHLASTPRRTEAGNLVLQQCLLSVRRRCIRIAPRFPRRWIQEFCLDFGQFRRGQGRHPTLHLTSPRAERWSRLHKTAPHQSSHESLDKRRDLPSVSLSVYHVQYFVLIIG
jgi:hypothetical protein